MKLACTASETIVDIDKVLSANCWKDLQNAMESVSYDTVEKGVQDSWKDEWTLEQIIERVSKRSNLQMVLLKYENHCDLALFHEDVAMIFVGDLHGTELTLSNETCCLDDFHLYDITADVLPFRSVERVSFPVMKAA